MRSIFFFLLQNKGMKKVLCYFDVNKRQVRRNMVEFFGRNTFRLFIFISTSTSHCRFEQPFQPTILVVLGFLESQWSRKPDAWTYRSAKTVLWHSNSKVIIFAGNPKFLAVVSFIFKPTSSSIRPAQRAYKERVANLAPVADWLSRSWPKIGPVEAKM